MQKGKKGMTSPEVIVDDRPFREVYVGPSGKSLLPGGFGRTMFVVGPRSPMAVRGYGCYVVDDAGRELIDFNNNFTSQIHGYAHPAVVEAGQKALANGTSFGLPNMHEIDHARMMVERLPYVEQIRYNNSGTEAVMLAVRVARAYTGRDKIVFVANSYHGHSEVALVPGGPKARRGVPAGVIADIIEVGINDLDTLSKVFEDNKNQIAAVVLDVLPNRAGLIALSFEFLNLARQLTTENGALLISDEVIALRQCYQGALFGLGVTPDLMAMGKIIGAGTPVGAVAGPEEFMSQLDGLNGGLEHGGTTAANPVTMATGLVTMQLFTADEVDRLNTLGGRIRTKLTAGIDQQAWEVRGDGSLFRIFRRGVDGVANRNAQIAVWAAAMERGVSLGQNTMGALSTPMNEAIIDDSAERIIDAVASIPTE